MTEADHIALCQRQDRKSQRFIYESYSGKMMALCLRYSKNENQAKEILQSGFIKLFSQIGNFKNQQSFDSWLKDNFITHAVQHLKSIRQEYYVASTTKADDKRQDIDLFHQGGEDDPNKLNDETFIQAIQQLPPSFRSVYNMNVIDGYTMRQVADTLEISEDTGKLNLEKARYGLFRNIQQLQKNY
jgi:RNA polymerase sigma factor (sigma-70 family)